MTLNIHALYGLTGFTFVNREQDLGRLACARPRRVTIRITWWKNIRSLTGDEPVCTTGVPGCAD
ncbi:MAG TPA: hypothetical protein ENK96_10645, partial [Desulfobulbaceae bacterium]|nr:hypothetical protein [Desulfobulbaceae bacterium]